jgi:hypothetical protein
MQLCAAWDAVKKNDTASRAPRAAGGALAPLSGFPVSILLLRLLLLRLLALLATDRAHPRAISRP